jgi:hypothetical protein
MIFTGSEAPQKGAAGLGDVPLIKLPLRCSACGALGHQIKVSGRSYRIGRVA